LIIQNNQIGALKDTTMIQDFDREALIDLLQQLNSDDDEQVLAAARALRAGMRASGKTWDDLLRQSVDEIESDDDDEDVPEANAEEYDEEDADDNEVSEDRTPSSGGVMSDEEALKLIDKMIKKFKVSAMMKEELEGYIEDIKDGEFEPADRRYLQSLHDRLAKSK
jgi:hypothetical protein